MPTNLPDRLPRKVKCNIDRHRQTPTVLEEANRIFLRSNLAPIVSEIYRVLLVRGLKQPSGSLTLIRRARKSLKRPRQDANER